MSMKIASTATRKLKSTVMFVASFALALGSVSFAAPQFFSQVAHATGTISYVTSLDTSYNFGGVYSAYYPSPGNPVSPGSITSYNGREAGIIKAGLVTNDEGLFGFKPTGPISDFASEPLTYDVVNQAGVNPVWMTIEVGDNSRTNNKDYQFIPTANVDSWHTVNAAAGQWQQMDDNGNGFGSLMTLGQVASANIGKDIIRTYLRLGMGESYMNGGTGTTAWVDKATIGGVTYDFVLPDTTPPTITNEKITSPGLWGDNYNILNIPNHLSTATGLPTIGGTVKVSADFSDDTLLTNAVALLPGRGFFFNEASWGGISTGTRNVAWNTKDATDWSKVSDGDYTFMFTAMDAGNAQHLSRNSSELPIRVTVDNTAPDLEFSAKTPAENSTVRGEITVEGNFTDGNGLMNTDIGVHNDGQIGQGWKCHTDWPTAGIQTCSIDTTKLSDGLQQLTMSARDKAGNTKQIFRTIVIDNTAPSLPTATLTAGGKSVLDNGSTDSKTFAFNLSSAGATRYQLKYWNDIVGSTFKQNSPWNPDVQSIYNDQFTQGEGTHYFAFSACDAAGNCSAYANPFTVKYDTTPIVILVLPVVPVPTNNEATATTPTAQVAPVAPIVGAAPYATAAPTAVATTTPAGEVLGASTSNQDAPAVAGAETSKDVAAEPATKDGFNSAWYWLLTIPVAGSAWWALAAFRRRES